MNISINNIKHFYITYETKSWPFYSDDGFALRNSLFGTIKLTKIADPDKYPYCKYGIEFDILGDFSLLSRDRSGKNIIIVDVDISSSVHIDKKVW